MAIDEIDIENELNRHGFSGYDEEQVYATCLCGVVYLSYSQHQAEVLMRLVPGVDDMRQTEAIRLAIQQRDSEQEMKELLQGQIEEVQQLMRNTYSRRYTWQRPWSRFTEHKVVDRIYAILNGKV